MSKIFSETVQPHFEANRAEYLANMRHLALKIWRERRLPAITINDLRRDPRFYMPLEIDPRVLGAVFKTKEWEVVEYCGSNRRECHGRPVARFRFVNDAAVFGSLSARAED